MASPGSKNVATDSVELAHDTGHAQTINVGVVDSHLQELARECPPFYKNRNLLMLYLRIIPGCLVPSVTLGFDGAMLNGLQTVPAWDSYFGHPRGAVLGILSAILALGAVCASPFLSVFGDRYGRRWAIFLGGLLMLLGAIIQATSINIGMFLASRFIIGLGLVFANAFSPILIGELAHPKDRIVVTSLYQTCFYIGSLAAAWVTFATFSIPNDWSWRIPSILQCVPASIMIVGVWFLPESPRWLLAKNRVAEAKAVFVKWHANGNEDDEFVQLEFKEVSAIIAAEMSTKTVWTDFIKTPGNRRRLLILIMLALFYQWSGNGLVSYYLARVLETIGITAARDQNILNGSLQIFNWITAVSSAFLTAYLKRRTQFLISVIGMFTVFVIQTLCTGLFNEQGNKTASRVVVPCLFMFYLFYNLAMNALIYSYPVEFLPYPLRAKGMSIIMFVGKSATFINLFLNPIGLQALGWKFYAVYVCWLALEIFCVYFFFVETKGPSLEAIAEKFDKKPMVIVEEQKAELGDAGIHKQ